MNDVSRELPTELRVRAHRITAQDVDGLAAVQVRAEKGEWLLRLPNGDFRICSHKTFRRDFKRDLSAVVCGVRMAYVQKKGHR